MSSEVLLPAGRTLHIEHRGEIYMLRKTRSGKLILTK
ncbi:hemin uptake protein HemP [Thiohalophilus sp.]